MNGTRISRRKALALGAAAGGFTFLPSKVLGRGGAVAPSDKLNIAMIGTGGRGAVNLRNLPNENIVALCDVDWRTAPGRAQQSSASNPGKPLPGQVRLVSEDLDKEYRRPAPTLARPGSHWLEWVECAKAGAQPSCDFMAGW